MVFSAGLNVYRSVDDGNTWAPGALLPGYVGALVASAGSLLAGVPEGRVYRSDDLGATWRRLPGSVPSEYSPFALSESAAGLFVGTDRGLFVSHDAGATFELFDRELQGIFIRSVFATDSAVYVGTQQRGIVTYPLPRRFRRLVPVVHDVESGRALFTTELSLTNRSLAEAAVTFRYTASLGSGSGSVTDRIPAGRQTSIPDVLAYLRLRGLAIPAGGQQAGTLLLTFEGPSDSGAVSVLARTTTATSPPQPDGRAGLAYVGVDPDAARATDLEIFGLRESSSDRSNVAIYNPADEPVTFSLTVYSGDGSGASVPISPSATLPPWGWVQANGILRQAGFSDGWVEVKRVSATGGFGAYGVINDNATNDGSYIEATRPAATPLFGNVPVLVASPSFQSELVLANAGDEPAVLTLTYVDSRDVPPGPGGVPKPPLETSLTLPARTQRFVPNALDAFWPPSAPGWPAGRTGALRISTSGATPGRLSRAPELRPSPRPEGVTASSLRAPGPETKPRRGPASPDCGPTRTTARTWQP